MRRFPIISALILAIILTTSCQQDNWWQLYWWMQHQTSDEDKTEIPGFGDINWSQVVKDGLLSTDKDHAVTGMKATAKEAEGISTYFAGRSSEPVQLVLSIEFTGYTEPTSGITIKEGSMSFNISATKSDNTSGGVTYSASKYEASTSDDLQISDSTGEILTSFSTESIIGTAIATIEASASSAGTQTTITVSSVRNISFDLTSGTGKVSTDGVITDVSDTVTDPDKPAVPAIGSEKNPYEIVNESDIQVLATMIDPEAGTFYAELQNDLALAANQSAATIIVPSGYDIRIDLGGHKLTRISSTAPDDDSTVNTVGDNSRYIFDINGGTLFIQNGTIGGSLFENPSARIFQLNSGSLYLDSITAYSYTNNGGAVIYMYDGNIDIRNSELYSTYTVINIQSGTATIDNSKLYSISSNQLFDYSYALIAMGSLNIDNSEVYGMQGAISASGPDCYLGPGVYSEVSADVFDKIPDDYRTFYNNWDKSPNDNHVIQPGELFYALYVSGEQSDSVSTVVEGGTYISYSPYSTVTVGNSADGGAGYAAYAEIKDGVFENRGKGHVVKDVNDAGPSSYGYGVLTITGGEFKDTLDDTAQWLEGFIDPNNYHVTGPDAEGFYSVEAI